MEGENEDLVSADPPDLRSISTFDCVYFCEVCVFVWKLQSGGSLLLPH